jgi:WD40 repeat protein
LLAVAEGERAVKVVHTQTGLLHGVFRSQTDVITAVALSRDGKHMACACQGGSVNVWDVTSPQEFQVLHRAGRVDIGATPSNRVQSILHHPDGCRLLVNPSSFKAELFDLAERRVLRRYELPGNAPYRHAFSLDGRQVALLAASGGFFVVNVDTDTVALRHQRPLPVGSPHLLAGLPNGGWLVGSIGQSVRGGPYELLLHDGTTGNELRRLSIGKTIPRAVTLSADGAHLAVLQYGGMVHLWSGDGSKLRFTVGAPFNMVGLNALVNAPPVFSSDSRWLAADTPEGVGIWSTADGQRVALLRTAGAKASSLAFHPVGTRLVAATVASSDATDLRVWDIPAGHELLKLRQPLPKIAHLGFTKDGQRLIGASNNEVLCWDGTPLVAR